MSGAQTTIAVTPSGVTLTYSTLARNQPASGRHQIVIWETGDDQNPIAVIPVPTDSPRGSLEIGALIPRDGFVAGYSAGPQLRGSGAQAWGNVCALAFVPSIGGNHQYFSSSISAVAQETSLIATFKVPPECTPARNGAWIGVWAEARLQSFRPITNRSGVQFDDVRLRRGATCAVVLFMSGYSSSPRKLDLHTAAASCFISQIDDPPSCR